MVRQEGVEASSCKKRYASVAQEEAKLRYAAVEPYVKINDSGYRRRGVGYVNMPSRRRKRRVAAATAAES